MDFVQSSVNLKSLRIIRVIRPLRTIKAVPSMRRLVTTLLKSLPEIVHSSIFVFFMAVLFAIIGL